MKKHQHPRTKEDGGDDHDNMELARKKKSKMNNSETEVDSSSSDHSCSVALAMASNLQKDAQCFPSSQNRFMTLQVSPNSLIKCRQYLSMPFMRKNGITNPRIITMVGKNGTKSLVNLRGEHSGKSLCLGKGWKEFAKENGLNPGRFFTLELEWENGLPVLKLFYSDSDRNHIGESSKANEKEPSIGHTTKKDKNSIDETSNSSSLIQNRLVTLALVPEDVKACKLHLPSQFMRANGINKLGKITLLGKGGMKCLAYLLSRDGFVALGIDWKGFCEANGVKIGESFVLEFIFKDEASTYLNFVPTRGTKNKNKMLN